MPSLLSIYNKALAHVGAKRITSVDDKNNRAEVCYDMYEFALDSALEAREWSFATARIKLKPNFTAVPPWGFNYAFDLPNLCISVLEVRNGRNNGVNWVTEGDYVFANVDSVDIRYVKKVTDTQKFTPTFVNALAFRLAADICVPLTENRTLAADLETKYQQEIRSAGALDGLQASRERLKCGLLVDVRRRGTTGDCADKYQGGTGVFGEVDTGIQGVAPIGTISGPTSAREGSNVAYMAMATGTPPITYQWFKDGVAISGATQSVYDIINLTPAGAGGYRCSFTNQFGSSVSNTIDLAVGCFPPVVVVTPTNEQINQGEPLLLTADVQSGNVPITLQWQKDTVDLTGETGTTLQINNVSPSDAGEYRVLASNECQSNVPSNVSTVTVTPDVAPTISISPVNPTVVEPASVLFTATVNNDGGDSNITYQWYKDGSPISGATGATYSTGPTAAGSFVISCVATNGAGASNQPTSTVTVSAALIRQTAFSADNPAFVLDADTVYVEVQGCGGGGGGGSPSKSANRKSAGGGGGASLVAVRTSTVTGGGTVAVVVGAAGTAGTSDNDGGDGGTSSVSGAGAIGLSWNGGKGGERGQTFPGFPATWRGGNGGNNSSGGGGALGNSTDTDAPDGVSGGGGAGGRYTNEGQGTTGNTETPSQGGKGGGNNGGAGGNPSVGDGFAGKSGGGGGGGNDAVWWDGTSAGAGADGGTNGTNGAVGLTVAATGYGNGGGGGHGSDASDTTISGLGSDGSGGYIIIREYRAVV